MFDCEISVSGKRNFWNITCASKKLKLRGLVAHESPRVVPSTINKVKTSETGNCTNRAMAKDINVVRKLLFSEDMTTILFINRFGLHFAFWRSPIEGNMKPHSSNYDIKVHGEEGEMKNKKSIAYMQKPKPRHVPPLCLDSTTRCREVFLFSQKAPTHEQTARISHCNWRCLLFRWFCCCCTFCNWLSFASAFPRRAFNWIVIRCLKSESRLENYRPGVTNW